MKLQEMKQGDNIIFRVNVKEKRIEFPSKVTLIEKDYILTEVVRIDERIVNFAGDEVYVDVVCIREGKSPVIWKNVASASVTYKKNVYYKIAAFSDGLETNRREAFRQFVGIDGVAQIHQNKKAVDVIVKDVSESGFSFVSSEDVEPAVNVPVRMVFVDFEKQYSLIGVIVRKVVIEENKILYGCSMTNDNPEIIKYINAKQRQQLSMHKGNAAYKTKKMLEESMREAGVAEILHEEEERRNRISQNADGKRAINQVSERQERRSVFKRKYRGKRV